MTESPKPISPLCQRMLEDVRLRKFSAKTQTAYVRALRTSRVSFGRSPDRADAEDLRRYQLHLVEQGVSNITLNELEPKACTIFSSSLISPRSLAREDLSAVAHAR